MPLPKKSKSIIGLKLSGDIYKFMESNAKYLNKEGSTIEEGNRAIAEAIAFGISKAMSDPKLKTNYSLLDAPLVVNTVVNGGVCVPSGPITGGIGVGTASSTHGTTFKTITSLFEES